MKFPATGAAIRDHPDIQWHDHKMVNDAASQNKVFDYAPEEPNKLGKTNSSLQTNDQPKLEPIEKPVVEANRKGGKNAASLYSFYQNIIDKHSEGGPTQAHKDKLSHPNYQIHSTKQSNEVRSEQKAIKESPSLAQKSSKFKNAGRDIGKDRLVSNCLPETQSKTINVF